MAAGIGPILVGLVALFFAEPAKFATKGFRSRFASELIADSAGQLVCKQKLYHALAREFISPDSK